MNKNDQIIKFYKQVNSLFKENKEFEFMNHGYHPIDNRLINNHILLKNSATLYFHVMSKLNIDNFESILEVGCGRGGGLSLIRDNYNAKRIHGCDICEENINYCIKNHDNIEFKVQDACNFSYEKKFDLILNIESSHCYNDLIKFFQRVSKSLKKNGFFLYADTFLTQNLNIIRNKLTRNFFILEEEDITQNVHLSCKNSIKILEENLKIKELDLEYNFGAYELLLSIFREKENVYKHKNHVFHIFVCQSKLEPSYT